jgi:hypothetical protein
MLPSSVPEGGRELGDAARLCAKKQGPSSKTRDGDLVTGGEGLSFLELVEEFEEAFLNLRVQLL